MFGQVNVKSPLNLISDDVTKAFMLFSWQQTDVCFWVVFFSLLFNLQTHDFLLFSFPNTNLVFQDQPKDW